MYSQTSAPCKTCHGSGESIEPSQRCKICKGNKLVKDTKVFDIEIPKGAPDGEKIILYSEGDELPNVEPGDVIVIISEQPHA